ncbi:MAG TPA: hypothetical protein VFF78_00420 [Anaerolineaceae bacterium]|nr:hypothetical protein [Anaerolineaceae bacterium]
MIFQTGQIALPDGILRIKVAPEAKAEMKMGVMEQRGGKFDAVNGSNMVGKFPLQVKEIAWKEHASSHAGCDRIGLQKFCRD